MGDPGEGRRGLGQRWAAQGQRVAQHQAASDEPLKERLKDRSRHGRPPKARPKGLS